MSHNVIALPHPCLARSHVLTFVKIGRAVVDKGHNFTLILSSQDAISTLTDAEKLNIITYPSLHTRLECLTIAETMANASPIGAAKIYVNVGVEFCASLLPLWDSLIIDQDVNVFLGELTWPCSSIVADMMDEQRANNKQRRLVRLLYHGNIMVDPFGEHFGLPSPANEAPGMGLATWMLSYDTPMSLVERVVNMIFREVSRQIVNNVMLWPYNKLRLMAGVQVTNEVQAMHTTASLILVPIVWGVEPPRALPPNWKPIHPVLPSPAKPLPTEIATWMESHCTSQGKELAVLSFGTQVMLTEKQSTKILNALSSLSEDFCFLWQLPSHSAETDGLSDQQHILTLDWIPQNDALHHASVFVSHVGYGSLYEAAYHGVPLVCIPMFGDQDDNAARAVHGGWGIRLNKDSFTVDEMVNAIHRASAQDSPLRARAKVLSELVQAKAGTDEIIEWMGYAAAHGVDHLVPFRTMRASYLSYYNLDAGFLSFCIIFMSMYTGYLSLRQCFKKRQHCQVEKDTKTE